MNRTEILQVAKPILFHTDMVRAIQDGRKTVTRRVIKLKYSNTHHEMFTNKYGTRLIEIQNDIEGETFGKREDGITWHKLRGYIEPKAPYKRGDYLYVRETWGISNIDYDDKVAYIVYRASKNVKDEGCRAVRLSNDKFEKLYDSIAENMADWRPSIHMPKEAARIFLRVTDVRAERLQDITEQQAIKEGIERLFDDLPDEEYIDWTKRTGIYPKQKSGWGYKNYLWHGNFGNSGTGNWKSDNWDYQYSSYENAVGSFSSLWNSTIPKKDLDKYNWDANPWVWVIEFERVEVES